MILVDLDNLTAHAAGDLAQFTLETWFRAFSAHGYDVASFVFDTNYLFKDLPEANVLGSAAPVRLESSRVRPWEPRPRQPARRDGPTRSPAPAEAEGLSGAPHPQLAQC